ncbi:hypothetical protein D3C81_1454210 [compost metagenome]
MLAHLNIIAALAGKQTGLLLHAVIITVQFVTTHAQAGGAAGTDDGYAETTTDAGLFGVVIIAILLALQRQITPGIHLHRFATGLRTRQQGIPTAMQRQFAATVYRRFTPERAIAMLTALALVGIGEHAQSGLLPYANTDADIAAAALVAALGLLRIGCAQQQHIPFGIQGSVAPCFELAAHHGNIATVGRVTLAGSRHLQVITGVERRASN